MISWTKSLEKAVPSLAQEPQGLLFLLPHLWRVGLSCVPWVTRWLLLLQATHPHREQDAKEDVSHSALFFFWSATSENLGRPLMSH